MGGTLSVENIKRTALGTDDIRSKIETLISRQSNYYWWWMLGLTIFTFISMIILIYTIADMNSNPDENFWNQENKGYHYNRTVLAVGVVFGILGFIFTIVIWVKYYKLLQQEDSFITDIAVLGDVSKLSAKARPALKDMIAGRLGEGAKGLVLPAVGGISQYLGRTQAFGGLTSDRIAGLINNLNTADSIVTLDKLYNQTLAKITDTSNLVFNTQLAPDQRDDVVFSVLLNRSDADIGNINFDPGNLEDFVARVNQTPSNYTPKENNILSEIRLLIEYLKEDQTWDSVQNITDTKLRNFILAYKK